MTSDPAAAEIQRLTARVAELEYAFQNAVGANQELQRRCERIKELEDSNSEWADQWEIAERRAKRWKEAARLRRRREVELRIICVKSQEVARDAIVELHRANDHFDQMTDIAKRSLAMDRLT